MKDGPRRKNAQSKENAHAMDGGPTETTDAKQARTPKPTLVAVTVTKWKELVAGGIIGWILSTAAFFITPYSDFVKYHLAGESQPFNKPTLANLTGDWAFTLDQKSGAFNGTLNLVQRRKKLSGDYSGELNGMKTYHGAVLFGSNDEAVTLKLMWDSGTRYWLIVAAVKGQDDARINLRSANASLFEACPVERCPDGWERKEDGIKFHAVAERY